MLLLKITLNITDMLWLTRKKTLLSSNQIMISEVLLKSQTYFKFSIKFLDKDMIA